MDKIAIVDFGSRYMDLIDLRLREFGVETTVLSPEDTEEIKDPEIKGLILSGGPKSVIDITSPKPHPNLFELDKPVLGICYGHQVIASQLGGKVERFDEKEYGEKEIEVETDDKLFSGIASRIKVWMSHHDFVIRMPDEFKTLIGREGIITAYKHRNKKIWGVQFHPEVYRSQQGRQIFSNFLDICNCPPQFSASSCKQRMIEDLKKKLEGKRALAILTGSAEDYVAAELAARATGDQNKLKTLFVEHGLHRQGELEGAQDLFASKSQLRIATVADEVYKELASTSERENKRKIVAKCYNDLIDQISQEESMDYLIVGRVRAGDEHQLTLRRGEEEDYAYQAQAEIERLNPIQEINRNQLRGLGVDLGLPDLITHRSPLLNPKLSLAAQIDGQVTEKKVKTLRKAEEIILDTLKKHGLLDKYSHVPLLLDVPFNRKGNSISYMLALDFRKTHEKRSNSFSRPKWQLLEDITGKISQQLPEVQHVVYDVTASPQ